MKFNKDLGRVGAGSQNAKDDVHFDPKHSHASAEKQQPGVETGRQSGRRRAKRQAHSKDRDEADRRQALQREGHGPLQGQAV